MSLKLLKQSLEILDEPLSKEKQGSHKKGTLNKVSRPSDQKQLSGYKDNTFNTKFKQKKNIDELRKEILPDKNKTNINLKRLLALSQNTINANDAEKIIKRNNKGKTIEKPKKKAKEPKSIFTEEDFLAFEREYFATNS